MLHNIQGASHICRINRKLKQKVAYYVYVLVKVKVAAFTIMEGSKFKIIYCIWLSTSITDLNYFPFLFPNISQTCKLFKQFLIHNLDSTRIWTDINFLQLCHWWLYWILDIHIYYFIVLVKQTSLLEEIEG